MPHLDMTITLGSLLTFIAILGTWASFIANTKSVLKAHADLINKLDQQFVSHENRDDARFTAMQTQIMDLLAGLNRLVGRSEFRIVPRESA